MSTPVYTVDAAVSSPQLSSDVRKTEEFSSRLKGKTDGVRLQVARVYIHNTPDGICYRFLYVRLDSLPFSSIDLYSGSADYKRLQATGREIRARYGRFHIDNRI